MRGSGRRYDGTPASASHRLPGHHRADGAAAGAPTVGSCGVPTETRPPAGSSSHRGL